ncbi:helix-turn-helix domain-containing protein [Bacteroidales bacterium OttesenSCG-928-A17]|nr:helix-turn-helix domain-containing protein [Bacteroidales bacterium OttesenSCG-928-A17]
MKTVGEKLAEVRKRKGLSQEMLSDLAKINLRTLQRIERGETEPRGHTLRSLCGVLEINIEELLDYGKKEDKKYLVILHLSVIVGLFMPLGDIIIPTILWLTQKDKITYLNKHGANILNFRICWDIIYFISLVAFVYSKMTHIVVSKSYSSIFLLYAIQLLVTGIYPIIVAVLVNKKGGGNSYYPKWIKIVR